MNNTAFETVRNDLITNLSKYDDKFLLQVIDESKVNLVDTPYVSAVSSLVCEIMKDRHPKRHSLFTEWLNSHKSTDVVTMNAKYQEFMTHTSGI